MNGNELKPRAEKALEWNITPQQMDLTLDMMRDRFYKQLDNLKSDTPPARDFYLRYSDVMAKANFDMGELSKTKFNEHGKKPLAEIGDWNCSYCDWKDTCYPQGIFSVDVENGVLTANDALKEYGIGGI